MSKTTNKLRDRYLKSILNHVGKDLRKGGHRIDPIEMMRALAMLSGMILSTCPEEDRANALMAFLRDVGNETEGVGVVAVEQEGETPEKMH